MPHAEKAPSSPDTHAPASLIVVDPSGRKTTVALDIVPFKIGRQSDNQLMVRDNRASRLHARIVKDQEGYWIEDLNSTHGTFVNGEKIGRKLLQDSDRIELGSSESYQLIFAPAGDRVTRLLESFPETEKAGGKLGKLKAITEVARALQTSLSAQDVLAAVVDAALAVTGADRGFLLLRNQDELEMKVARDSRGVPLLEKELQVPRRVIDRALSQRRELLSMTFSGEGVDPAGTAERSIADLSLRSVVCIPLVRIRTGGAQETSVLSAASETVGALYLDSRQSMGDLAAKHGDILQTLALEASTILENARLLDQERAKQKIEEELKVARQIQQGLFPRKLPTEGWFRASGSSVASLQVGGDYFDVLQVDANCWSATVADVAGKGVSSALLACYLQGALSAASYSAQTMQHTMEMINRFLDERAESSKYATVFHGTVNSDGTLRYVNAGHCAPLLVSPDGKLRQLDTTSFPLGLIPGATFAAEETTIQPGEKIIIYSDGVSEAHGPVDDDFYGTERLEKVITAHAAGSAEAMHEAILDDLRAFTLDTPQADDVTLVVLEFRRAG